MITDRLEFVRSALVGVLSVGLWPDAAAAATAAADRNVSVSIVSLKARCSQAASADLRTHTLQNYSGLSTAATRSVMCEMLCAKMVDHDLGLWVNELMLLPYIPVFTVVSADLRTHTLKNTAKPVDCRG